MVVEAVVHIIVEIYFTKMDFVLLMPLALHCRCILYRQREVNYRLSGVRLTKIQIRERSLEFSRNSYDANKVFQGAVGLDSRRIQVVLLHPECLKVVETVKN